MFSPQTRMNRFVFLNLSVLSLEVHLGVTASPHTPFPTGYVTLPVHGRSPPLRLMPSHSRERPSLRTSCSTRRYSSHACARSAASRSRQGRGTRRVRGRA